MSLWVIMCSSGGVQRSGVRCYHWFIAFNIKYYTVSYRAHNEMLSACEQHKNVFYLMQLWGNWIYKRKQNYQYVTKQKALWGLFFSPIVWGGSLKGHKSIDVCKMSTESHHFFLRFPLNLRKCVEPSSPKSKLKFWPKQSCFWVLPYWNYFFFKAPISF